uniref:Uncharacterized protein n=1 Tax=Rangifer tarandus platyrhynchus TaxID=3082113 RepID=A0ACB0ESB3_RANTA|nr:unnamed protein product [Rangifer tarandus platyrhynchus]
MMRVSAVGSPERSEGWRCDGPTGGGSGSGPPRPPGTGTLPLSSPPGAATVRAQPCRCVGETRRGGDSATPRLLACGAEWGRSRGGGP